MPWRALPGQRPDPYHVWLSEIMLQQTTVVTVTPYFLKFIQRWPQVKDLAAAELDDVLAMWAGLGYYARARNLHKCAKAVVADCGGIFPQTVEGLLELPGIGPYTAAAIASIAFNQPAVAVDGNVERVVCRLEAIKKPVATAKADIMAKAQKIAKGVKRPGDFTQAFMELGATVCTPRQPKCGICPWSRDCVARQQGIAADLPIKAVKKPKPLRRAIALWHQDAQGRFVIEKRPNLDKGLFAGMYQLPMLENVKKKPKGKKIGEVHHVFTHFNLILEIYAVPARKISTEQRWISTKDVAQYALPSLMKKAIGVCLGE